MPTASQAAILQNLLVSYEENCGLVAGGSCSHCNSVAAQDISVGVGRLEGAASEAGLQCCSVDSDSADCSESLAGARNNIRSDSPQTFRQVLSDCSTVCNDCRLGSHRGNKQFSIGNLFEVPAATDVVVWSAAF